VGGSSDEIDPTGGGFSGDTHDQKKHTVEWIAGVTRALSSVDIVQLNLTYSAGHGYYDDPYKAFDVRPDQRKQDALLARWNHHLLGDQSTLRTSYRFYRDNFGVDAHTLQGEWVKPVTAALAFTPLVRLYSQSAADFYADARVDASGFPIVPALQPGQLNSGDQRLSSFGAVTLGLKTEYKLDAAWTVDLNLEAYEQRSKWHLGGSGSSGVDTFRARFIQLGASRKF
jgi:hypothetical protein